MQATPLRRISIPPSSAAAPLAPTRPAPCRDAGDLKAVWAGLRSRTTATAADEAALAGPEPPAHLPAYAQAIENMIGTVKVPVGLAGPLRVRGQHADGDYLVPLATTEAALVASYDRGARALLCAGGAEVALTGEAMLRTPGFAFAALAQARGFAAWCAAALPALRAAAEATTSHGRLTGLEPRLEGDTVYLLCRYTTGDAAGQNMATIATQALCEHALLHAPVRPRHWFVEANCSGDKKASALAAFGGRGRSAIATAALPADVVARVLRADPERMVDYWRMAALGGVLSGTVGVQGHVANGLAALYLATGQDVACVAESAVGITRLELRGGVLHASVTLPSLVLGTVGGGTGLPSQSAALRLMNLAGPGKAAALAEVAAALCLAGELSIIAALASNQFTEAHRRLARGGR